MLNTSGSPAGHIVQGVSAATDLTTGLVIVTLAGTAVFTNASTYTCEGRDSTNSTVAVVTAYTNGTSFDFQLTGTNRGHTVTFFCVGS